MKQYLFITLAIAFALKVIFLPDLSVVILSLAFLTAHMISDHFETKSVSALLVKRLTDMESSMQVKYDKFASDTTATIIDATKEVADLKAAQAQFNLAVGIKSSTRFLG